MDDKEISQERLDQLRVKIIDDSVEEEVSSADESFEDNESEKDNDSNEFEPEEDLTDENFNQSQEEELLDIPTFLRRQAN